MRIKELMEVNHFSKKFNNDQSNEIYNKLLRNARKITSITTNIDIFENQDHYMVVRNNHDVLGYVKFGEVSFNNNTYSQIDMIYALPKYRVGKCITWLISILKNNAPHPIVVDGAVFKDGTNLLGKIINKNIFTVKVLGELLRPKGRSFLLHHY